jgi:putative ABC transport system permease protein
MLKLALKNYAARRARMAITIAAVALSVALVVSVTSGYESLKATVWKFVGQIIGSFDARVTFVDDRSSGIGRELVDALRADPDVRNVIGRIESSLRVDPADGRPVAGFPPTVTAIDPAVDDTVQRMPAAEGRWFASADAKEIVLDQVLTRRLGVKLGDAVDIPTPNGKATLAVVGIVYKPGIIAHFKQSAYVPLKTVQPLVYAGADKVSELGIQFHAKIDQQAFLDRWQPRVHAANPGLRLALKRDDRAELDNMMRGVDLMSYMGGAVSMVAATFIVFSTLSMGVTERQRTLAMLRAIGASKGQVGRLVVYEGVLLGLAGALIGVPLGLAFVQVLVVYFGELFASGLVVSWGGVAFAGGCVLVASLLASIMPAISAARVDPLEAMAPLARKHDNRAPLGFALLGATLASADALILYVPWDRVAAAVGFGTAHDYLRDFRLWAHFIVGIPCVLVGLFLVAPLVVWLLDRAATPALSRLLFIRGGLLRQQLSGGLWRAAGTGAALMVGLAILIVMHTQARSTVNSWTIPSKFPDVFVWTGSLTPLSPDDVARIAAAPGVRPGPGNAMPIAFFDTSLGDNVFGLATAMFDVNRTKFIGVDPDIVFDMMQLDFRQGDAATAKKLLRDGKHVLITEEFARLKGYTVGSPFPIVSRTKGTVEYKVAGVIWSPGIDVMVASFDLEQQMQKQTIGTVFGSLADARDDFGVNSARLVGLNLQLGVDKQQLVAGLQKQLGDSGLSISDVRQLKAEILQQVNNILFLGSTVAWCAMGVASLGVTNTIVAGVRTRRWQFGVLRAVGVTRGALLRMLLAEGLLLGAVGGAMGLLGGLVLAFNARRFYDVLIGHLPPLTIPWNTIGAGTGVVLAAALLATLIPALQTGRAEPLSLLQAGRASA